MQKYKDIDPSDTAAIKKRNLLRRKKQAATMKKNKKKSPISENRKNYYQSPLARLAAARYNDELMPGQYDLQDPEFKILLYEIDKVKLYLYDITKRLETIEGRIPYPAAPVPAFSPTALIPELDRNALYKGPNANKGQDFVRKNVAQILKNMLPKATLDMMPKEVRDAYHNILSVMGAPNDPIWEKEPRPDPREPHTPHPNETFQNVADLWNNVASNMKKLDGVNLSEEISNAAREAFNVPNQSFEPQCIHMNKLGECEECNKEEKDNKDGKLDS